MKYRRKVSSSGCGKQLSTQAQIGQKMGVMGQVHQHGGVVTHQRRPTQNDVRMSRHRMCERIVASLTAAVPRTVQALLALLLAWWLYH